MELILIVKALAGTLVTMHSSAHSLLHQGVWGSARVLPRVLMHVLRLIIQYTLSTVYLITQYDHFGRG